MEIIIHRVNTIRELKKIEPVYGTEIDVRAWKSNLILNHEPFYDGEKLIDYLDEYQNGTLILNIKEDGIEIFKFSNNQFLSNLNNSKFFIAKGKTIAVEDFNLRTKLLTLLSRINQKPKDFKKIIKIYYENPVAVLKKAGLL